MKTEVIRADAPGILDRVLPILRAGGLVAFPTDTVYGLGSLAFDGEAVSSIYAAKDRPPEKAIPVLIGDIAQLDQIAAEIPSPARKLAERFWPGPLTIVFPKRERLPEAVSATPTVGVRIPDHDFARALLRAAGPMAVTSANISGQASPRRAAEVMAQLNGRIPLIVDGGETPGGLPSTLVDCTGERLNILRDGPITENELLAALS